LALYLSPAGAAPPDKPEPAGPIDAVVRDARKAWGVPGVADALRDGVLIDVSSTAREAGFKYPVALTAAAWAKCIAVPPGVFCQDEAGRLCDVLTMLRHAVRGQGSDARGVRFGVHVRNDNRERTPPLVRLKALCGPGDEGEPVITILLPDED
jgi:hypothetical protein